MSTYAQFFQIGPLFSGGVQQLLKVYHYTAGTTSLKNTYDARDLSTAGTLAQPMVSDAEGIVSFFGDGLYKFRIDGSADGVVYTTLYTYDNYAVVDQSTTLSGEGAAIASASTVTLGTDGNIFHITGSTGPIIALSGTQNEVTLIFDSTPTLTHSGNLILQNATSIVATAGDVISFVNEGSGVWREQSRLLAANPANSGVQNPIINGDFSVAQAGTSFTSTTVPINSDDTYLLDRWTLLSDGNDIVDVTQETTTVPTNGLYAMRLDVETVDKKFGIIQFVEQKNCKGFIGNNCTLSFKLKMSSVASLDNFKAAILSWTGTADTVTSDVVSAWGLEGTNPTLVANWTYENTPINLNPTTDFATYSVTAAIDTASTKNIAVFLWSDVTSTTLGHFAYITDVKLEAGTSATAFQYRTFNEELNLCRRYLQKSFLYGTTPAQNTENSTADRSIAGKAGAAAQLIHIRLNPPMRAAPTVTLYNPDATNAEMRDMTAAADCSSTSASVNASVIDVTATGNGSTAVGNQIGIHWKALAEL
jgi:hypothetical protein